MSWVTCEGPLSFVREYSEPYLFGVDQLAWPRRVAGLRFDPEACDGAGEWTLAARPGVFGRDVIVSWPHDRSDFISPPRKIRRAAVAAMLDAALDFLFEAREAAP